MEWKEDIFAKRSKLHENLAHEVIQAYPFEGNERILDLGCGEGLHTYELSQKVQEGSVLGVDHAAEKLKRATHHYRDIPQLNFSLQDIQNFTFSDRFHAIFSFGALHFTPSLKKAIGRIREHLLPGGVAVLRFAIGNNPAFHKKFHDSRWTSDFKKTNPFHIRDRESVEETFLEFPFSDLYFYEFTADDVFESPKALKTFLNSWIPFATGLKPKKAEQFIGELIEDCYKAEELDVAGPITLSMPYFHVEVVN